MSDLNIFKTPAQKEYALLDSGDGMKLERYGSVTLSRPDPQALWRKRLSEKEWGSADASFVRDRTNRDEERGTWVYTRKGIEDGWKISFADLIFNIKPTPFKHTGIFPEQFVNWKWSTDIVVDELKKNPQRKIKVLNLFGYTGGATVAMLKAGAEVTHVDASKSALTWANLNAESTGVKDLPVRWILDDAYGFVKREIRRGNTYDAIIMDPPAFGRGAKGEVWRIEESFLPFFEDVLKLLSDNPLFVILNGYAAGYSPVAYDNNMQVLVQKYGGELSSGELGVEEEKRPGVPQRILPCGIVSRWRKTA
ncbi:MAG: SAM-dependent methyltransferase [Candidatus Taylorbacteria bacterium]|nr:SAM-dependent methyltransferase [Candidatus Taylorbacteria bacterium]